jgi:hypothetical protein
MHPYGNQNKKCIKIYIDKTVETKQRGRCKQYKDCRIAAHFTSIIQHIYLQPTEALNVSPKQKGSFSA